MVLLEAVHVTITSLALGLVLGILYGWIAAQSLLGAVRVPHTPEAMALHYADNLDAKMAQCRGLFAQIEGEGEAWTPWQATLGRPVHRAARTPDKAAPATRKKAVKEECLSLLKV